MTDRHHGDTYANREPDPGARNGLYFAMGICTGVAASGITVIVALVLFFGRGL